MSKVEILLKEVENVNWEAVPSFEVDSANLAIDFFKESDLTRQLRQVALGTALGGVLSTSVLAILALLMGASVQFTLGLILVHQALRAGILWWHSRKATSQYVEIEKQTISTAERLAKQYPVEDVAA